MLDPLYVGRPNLGDRTTFITRVNEMLDRRWLSNDGPLVREFEAEVSRISDTRHAVATCNATVALELAARALGMHGEVIIPSYTFVATAHALQWQGIAPVFVDIDKHTHTLDPAKVEEAITPSTTGIIGVHLWGTPCDVERLEIIARRHSLALMYDASHAFNCSHKGKMIGGFGRCEVFSFHATKFINCLEGGAIVTNDDDLASRLRLMRNFGFHGFDNVTCLGINGKMNEVCAAMGLSNLAAMDDIVAANRRNYDKYVQVLSDIPGVEVIKHDTTNKNNFQYVVIQVDSQALGSSRDELVAELHKHNVIARKYFWPGCHRMEPYRSLQPLADQRLPVTNGVAANVLVMPTGTSVTLQDIDRVGGIVKNFAELRRI